MEKHYIILISKLVDTFSRVIAGKEFDFTLSTSQSSLSDSKISKNDFLIASVNDKVYYQFKVIIKTFIVIHQATPKYYRKKNYQKFHIIYNMKFFIP